MNEHLEQAVNPKYRSRMPQLPVRLQRRGNALLNQQCWVWGRDVRHGEGNLLLAYGFEQFRRPGDAVGGTAYKLELCDDSSTRNLILWGFGLYYANADYEGGIFMNRFNFSPKLSTTVALSLPLWEIDQLPPMRMPVGFKDARRALQLLAEACAVIEAYEKWVTGVFGRTYRLTCLMEFAHTTFTPEEAIAEWGSIKVACEQVSNLSSG
jgi:hypothetical protein